jgi:hypothetical protein
MPIRLFAALLLVPLLGCKVYDPLYCDEKRPCSNPDRPFCDLHGDYPASEGVGRTCIPEPRSNAAADAGPKEPDEPDGSPDASPPAYVREGLIAVTETFVSNTYGAVTGAVVSIAFADTTTTTVEPVKGFEDPNGGCQIFVYDLARGPRESDEVDEGIVRVSGTANGDFDCAFDSGTGEYFCRSADPMSIGGDAEGILFDGSSPISSFLDPSVNFSREAVVGAQLLLNGFGEKALDGRLFPIRARSSPGLLELITPGLPRLGLRGPPGATYAPLIGAGPIPNTVGYDFFNEKSEITISKQATALVPAFEVTYTPEGDGLLLTDDPEDGFYLPHQLPTATNPSLEVKFSCFGNGCGNAGSGPDATRSMAIIGRTTDGPRPPPEMDPDGTLMPDPVGSYATFRCVFSSPTNEATISAAAMAVILGTEPTRIETTVLRSVGSDNATPASDTAVRVVVGHSHTGYTTVPPNEAATSPRSPRTFHHERAASSGAPVSRPLASTYRGR